MTIPSPTVPTAGSPQSEPSHTPGPWEAWPVSHDKDGTPHLYVRCGGDAQCRLIVNTIAYGAISREQANANARLIAAAPDLLAACKAHVRLCSSAPVLERWQVRIDDVVESGHDSRQNAVKRIAHIRRAAITKAGGVA